MEDRPKVGWQARLATLTPLIPFIGIVVGVGQFSYAQRENSRLQFALRTEEARINYTRELWDQQFQAYRNVAEIVGDIAAASDDGEISAELINKFESAYWGFMVLFKDDGVESAMIALYQELRQYQDDFSDSIRVRQAALRFIDACRVSAERKIAELSQ